MLEQLLPPSTYFKKSCFLNFHNKRLGLVSWPCRYHQIWFKKQAAQFKFLLAEFLKFITDRSRHCKKPGIFLDRNSCCWFLHCPPRFVILVNEILLDVCSRASAWAIEILFRWTWSRSLNKYIWRQHNWAMWNLRLYSLTWNFGKQTSLITLQQYTVQGVTAQCQCSSRDYHYSNHSARYKGLTRQNSATVKKFKLDGYQDLQSRTL